MNDLRAFRRDERSICIQEERLRSLLAQVLASPLHDFSPARFGDIVIDACNVFEIGGATGADVVTGREEPKEWKLFLQSAHVQCNLETGGMFLLAGVSLCFHQSRPAQLQF